MLIRPYVIGLAILVLYGQTLAGDNSRYKEKSGNRNKDAQQTVNTDKAPTPSEMETLSRSEIKKKLEAMDEERKRASDR